jgi:gluconolactonase
VIADRFGGKRLNSPNDVVVRSDGTIWFTDPAYGIDSDYEGHQATSEIGACNVYRVDPTTSQVALVADDFDRPNGLAFSLDESLLYVADTRRNHIRVFPVDDNGEVGPNKVFLNARPACSTASVSTTQDACGRVSARRHRFRSGRQC